MKRILFSAILICLALTAIAQPRGRHPQGHSQRDVMKIEEFVSDLSTTQKAKIDLITKRTSKNIETLRLQVKEVRDSIRTYMGTQEDRSDVLFPLYEREGRLQAELSKEYYRSKAAIDKVLTPDQYQKLREAMENSRLRKNPDEPVKPKPTVKPTKVPVKK